MASFVKNFLSLFNIAQVIRALFANHELIRILTWRDFRARFRGSTIGIAWAFIQPALLMLVYTLVFSYFLQVKFQNNDSQFIFAIYLLCGLLPWTAFADCFQASTQLIRANLNLVKRVVFPLEILPVNISLVALLQQLFGTFILLVLTVLILRQLTWLVLFIPVILLIQFLFMTGVNWIWASASVIIPDLRQITSLLTSVLMFATPVFYPQDVIPQKFQFLVSLNPLARIIHLYRQVILESVSPSLNDWLITTVFSLGFFLIGYFLFSKTKSKFADFI